jgi:hypothetical protein
MTERINLVIATPCFGGQVSSIYASSVFALQRELRATSNVNLTVHMRDGDALITRAPAQRPISCSSPLRFTREHSHDELAGNPNRFALFECIIDPVTGTYLREDFAFCRRWTDIGGEIWADLDSRLDHVGHSVFRGDVASQFAAAPAAADAA